MYCIQEASAARLPYHARRVAERKRHFRGRTVVFLSAPRGMGRVRAMTEVHDEIVARRDRQGRLTQAGESPLTVPAPPLASICLIETRLEEEHSARVLR